MCMSIEDKLDSLQTQSDIAKSFASFVLAVLGVAAFIAYLIVNEPVLTISVELFRRIAGITGIVAIVLSIAIRFFPTGIKEEF